VTVTYCWSVTRVSDGQLAPGTGVALGNGVAPGVGVGAGVAVGTETGVGHEVGRAKFCVAVIPASRLRRAESPWSHPEPWAVAVTTCEPGVRQRVYAPLVPVLTADWVPPAEPCTVAPEAPPGRLDTVPLRVASELPQGLATWTMSLGSRDSVAGLVMVMVSLPEESRPEALPTATQTGLASLPAQVYGEVGIVSRAVCGFSDATRAPSRAAVSTLTIPWAMVPSCAPPPSSASRKGVATAISTTIAPSRSVRGCCPAGPPAQRARASRLNCRLRRAASRKPAGTPGLARIASFTRMASRCRPIQ
jgi:hypothetical protein